MNRRAKLFGVVFDLNQTPLSSPRETVADGGDEDVVVVEPPALSLPRRNEAPPLAAKAGASPAPKGEDSGREADGESMLCIDCRSESRPRGPRLVESNEQWRCFRCLLKDRGSEGVGSRSEAVGGSRGGGVALLDINASPPQEMEVEAVYAGPGDDVAWHRNHGHKVQAGSYSSFSGRPVGFLSTSSNMVWPEKGFHLPKPPNIIADMARSGSDGIGDHGRPSETSSHMIDFGSAYEGGVRATNSTPTDYYSKSQNELYLQGLGEYIAERKGVLSDGWHVEFVFCNKQLKTIAVFHAPDGSKFESMFDVARHLGLSTNPHPPQSENVEDGSVFMQNGMPLNQRRKESSWFTRASNSRQRPSIPRSGSFNSSQDCFPIQFEDFYLISVGVIDSRPSYRNTNQICPVGYRSIWHDKITGSLFVFGIADGGDSGPSFMVQRYPCVTQTMPSSSTVLSRPKCEDNEGKDDSNRYGVIDEESISIQMMLTESSPPHLDDDIAPRNIGDNECDSQKGNLSSSYSFSQRSGDFTSEILGPRDIIGEFSVEGRSPSYVWEKVCETFLHACYESYNQKGFFQLGCDHCEMNVKELEDVDSLSKFTHLAAPLGTPRIIRSSDEFHSTCELVSKWLQQDRFGLDAEFVQEIIELLPGVSSCSGYTLLTKRKHHSTLQTVGSGFLQAKRKCDKNLEVESDGYFGILKRAIRGPFPPGKPFFSRLPADLISDALQVWEFSWRFCEVLGLQPFSFQELEGELINPWLDGLNPLEKWGTEIRDSGNISFGSSREASQARVSCHSCCRCTGIILTKTHGSLLKVLVGELLSKVSAYVDPNFDAGESKSRRGRKKDAEHSAVLKKMKLDMMPVNELTWPEIARRYILAVLCMEGNLDSAEIAFRESGKVFHCLRGDGGTLCGSLTGVAALEADALLLAEATKKIFGSLMTQNEAVSTVENESDAAAASKSIDANNGELPEWAQVLEPVRKLPTNVGARIRKCVYEALSRNPPEWAKKKLEHSISKEVYKGNASGPTKRAVVEVLADVTREKLQQKPEKKENVKSVYTASDLIMKQCRIVLRQAVSADKDRVFCNLLARTILNPNDNDDEGILGHPAMVSRPLDFRTIDMRLAAGAYGGSHEAFLDDVREVWHNVRTAYRQSDLIELAETLSQQFEDLYKIEVLTFVQKTMGAASTSESEKEKDEILACANDSSLPKAPWDEGICKVCGMDKDDDNVLLCDSCDSEYHTYCLNPPLIRIPEGNWYCPSCVTGKSLSQSAAYCTQIVNQCGKRRYKRKHTDEILEGLAQLAKKMELKEYWEFTVEERVFLIKFMCDEAMNSAIIREHVDQCATMSFDLQQRLRSLNSERKILKLKEESLAANVAKTKGNVHSGGGELGLNELAPVCADEAQMPDDNNISPLSGGSLQMEDGTHTKDHNDFSDQSSCYTRSTEKPFDSCNSQNLKTASTISQNVDSLRRDDNLRQKLGESSSSISVQSTSHPMPGYDLCSTVSKHTTFHASSFPGHQCANQTNASSLQEYNAEFRKLQQEISGLQESINTSEADLLKVSLRKESLGRDSYGRLYWVFARPGASPWIVANGNLNAEAEFGLDNLFPKSTSWMYYDTATEIEQLVNWLDDCDMRERELKESILQWQSNKSLHTDYSKMDILTEKSSSSMISSSQGDANPNLVLKAVRALEKKFGPGLEIWANHVHKNPEHDSEMTYQGRMCRCDCLELFWPSRHHCFSCHKTFSTSEDFAQHGEKCRTVATGPDSSQFAPVSLKHKKMVKNQGAEICSGSSNVPQTFLNEKHDTRSNCFKHPKEPECPFNFEEIMSKFKVENSLKELVKGVGLVSTSGVVPFVPNSSSLNDPALNLVPLRDNVGSLGDRASVPEGQRKLSDNVANVVSGVNYKFSDSARSIENDKDEVSEVQRVKPRILSERGKLSSMKDRSSLGTSRRSMVRESSLRPKVGKASEILRCLKINLLDMDAALPEAALRASRSHLDRRCAWRTFVKSANTLYEMVQALIILEDTIRTDYLRNDWWYWSSPSAAANISTLSALAFRIYTLDSAIFYENPLTDDTIGTCMPDGKSDKEVLPTTVPKNDLKASDQPMQKMHDSDSGENSRPRTRMSKRRKDSSG